MNSSYTLPELYTQTTQPPEESIKTVAELIDSNAEKNPHRHFCFQMQSDLPRPHRITYKILRNTISTCQVWILSTIREAKRPKTNDAGEIARGFPVALLMDSNIEFLIHLFALLGLGIPALLLSPQLKPNAIHALLAETSACAVIISPRLKATADEIFSLFDSAKDLPGLYPCILHKHWAGPSYPKIAWDGHYTSDSDVNVLILHTSGTTGVPKAIRHSHRYLLSFAPISAFQHDHDIDAQSLSEIQGLAFPTVPLYHGFGLLSPMMSLSVGKPFVIPPSGWKPSAQSILDILCSTKAKTMLVAPLIVQDLVEFLGDNMEPLQLLDSVFCGGGPLSQKTSNYLISAGLTLINVFGTTEAGYLSALRPLATSDWPYFRLRTDIKCSIDEIEPSFDGKSAIYRIKIQPPGWNEVFLIDDLFITDMHDPKKKFQPIQGTDDVIVLSTGEKVQPSLLEQMLEERAEVHGALAFGNGRVEMGVLVEPAYPVSRREASKFRALLWPTILEAGKKMVSHARVSLDAICVLEPSQHLPRSAKGSVLRSVAYRQLSREIEHVYDLLDSETAYSSDTTVDSDRERGLVAFIESRWRPDTLPTPSQDLFEWGMDSRQALELRRFLERQANRFLPKNIIYTHPTISGLASFLDNIDPYNSKQSFQQLMDQYISGSGGRQMTVLLTGGTGSLGSHLLARLAMHPKVVNIICLNRVNTDLSARARQTQSCAVKGAHIPLDVLGKTDILETDISQPRFGLSHEQYAGLRASVTHIVHNAWPVHFNRSVDTFQSQFTIMANLIEFALAAEMSPRFLFISSVAVVAHQGLSLKNTSEVVPEKSFKSSWPMPTPSCESDWEIPSTGYGQAKLICEKMLEVASENSGLDGVVARCGQISGSRYNGYWNPSEHVPLMLQISQEIGCLPFLEDNFSWLPIEDTAGALVDILVSPVNDAIYHVQNPVQQSWKYAIDVFSEAMNLPVVPLQVWLDQTRKIKGEHPLTDFFKGQFQQISTGLMKLDTEKASKVSRSLRNVGVLDKDLLSLYARRSLL